MCVGPMVYFFPAGLKTFLDSLVSLIGMPVMTVVFSGFIFHYLPKWSARAIMLFHYIAYGLYLILFSNSWHYLYTVFVLVCIEFLFLFVVNYQNKKKGAQRFELEDVGAVDLTPWKYRKPVAVVVTLCVIGVYVAFSPLGFGRW